MKVRPGEFMPAECEQARRAMHDAGMLDTQIAAVEGTKPDAIFKWRKRRGLAPNVPRGRSTKHRADLPVTTPELRRRCIALLERNVSASLIARELNVSIYTLNYWRAAMLERLAYARPVGSWHRPPRHPNGRLYSPMHGERRREALLLYADGLNDYALAEQLGITRQQAWEWRNALGLPKLEPRKAPAKVRPKALTSPITPLSNALHAHIMQAIGRGIAPDMADDVASDMWLAIAEGKLTPADVAAQAKRFRYGVLKSYADGKTRSLDEDLTGDGFRMLDMLRDNSSSDWLEEMGATVW